MLPQNIDIHGIDTPSADEAVAFLTRPLPSDLSAMISHAATVRGAALPSWSTGIRLPAQRCRAYGE